MMIFGVEIEDDHTFTRKSLERYLYQAYRAGQEDELNEIVAWLKSKSHHAGSRENELAEAIKAGEHLK